MGGNGIDRLYGGYGNDSLIAGLGDDHLYGGYGQDVLEGGSGDDRLYGGRGKDVLEGGDGDDMLTGGSGEDTFVLDVIFGDDTITDFDGSSDIIDLTSIMGASVTTAANSNGDVKLIVEDSQGQKHGTLTLDDVSLEDWNALDQENILLYTV